MPSQPSQPISAHVTSLRGSVAMMYVYIGISQRENAGLRAVHAFVAMTACLA